MEYSDEIIEKLTKLEIFSDFTEKNEENIRILKAICQLLEIHHYIPFYISIISFGAPWINIPLELPQIV